MVIFFLVFWCAVFRVSGEAWDKQEALFEQQLLRKADNQTENDESHQTHDNKSESSESTSNVHGAFEIKKTQ